jgi:hypothetical protein
VKVSGAMQAVIVTHIGSDQQVDIEGAELVDNAGLSFCVGGFSSQVRLRDSLIRRTAMAQVPSSLGQVVSIGDGVEWTAGSELSIDGLVIEASARQSLLIDGPVPPTSRIANLELRGGDEDLGILQQKVLNASQAPEVGPGSPPVTQTLEPIWQVICP